MEALHTLIPLLITTSLAGLVLAVGLNAERGDLLYVLRRPAQLLKAIFAVIIVPPLAAAVIILAANSPSAAARNTPTASTPRWRC